MTRMEPAARQVNDLGQTRDLYTAEQIRSLVEEVRATLTMVAAAEAYGWGIMDTCNAILARLEGKP